MICTMKFLHRILVSTSRLPSGSTPFESSQEMFADPASPARPVLRLGALRLLRLRQLGHLEGWVGWVGGVGVVVRCGQNRFGISFWLGLVNSPPILEPFLVLGLNRIFTAGTIWLLTHGQMGEVRFLVNFLSNQLIHQPERMDQSSKRGIFIMRSGVELATAQVIDRLFNWIGRGRCAHEKPSAGKSLDRANNRVASTAIVARFLCRKAFSAHLSKAVVPL